MNYIYTGPGIKTGNCKKGLNIYQRGNKKICNGQIMQWQKNDKKAENYLQKRHIEN